MSSNEKIDDGGPAFSCLPPAFQVLPDGNVEALGGEGLSIRDWFAGQGLAGAMANAQAHPLGAADISGSVARLAYRVADAMLAERAKARGEQP